MPGLHPGGLRGVSRKGKDGGGRLGLGSRVSAVPTAGASRQETRKQARPFFAARRPRRAVCWVAPANPTPETAAMPLPDRRSFLKASAGTLTALSAARAAEAPNEKLLVAVMGV